MPHKHEWQSRIKAVERESIAIRQATERFIEQAQADPAILKGELRHREILFAYHRLEGTYTIRLFAEFETGLRSYWSSRWRSFPKTSDLLDSNAARCEIPDIQRRQAHSVREFRNSLVHERDDAVEVVSLPTSRGHLCRFFSFLPQHW